MILPCATRYYCLDLVTTTICPEGTYNPSTGQSNLTACLVCPAGSSCLVGSTVPKVCAPYSYSNEGWVNANSFTCNLGYCMVSHTYFNFNNSSWLTVPTLGCFAGSFLGTTFAYTTTGCSTGAGGCLIHSLDNTRDHANQDNPLTDAMNIPGMTKAGTGGMTVAYWVDPGTPLPIPWIWVQCMLA